MLFIDDGDARSVSTAHPLASVWDNGSDAIEMLKHEMEVRRLGLKNFGLKSINLGQPLSAPDICRAPASQIAYRVGGNEVLAAEFLS